MKNLSPPDIVPYAASMASKAVSCNPNQVDIMANGCNCEDIRKFGKIGIKISSMWFSSRTDNIGFHHNPIGYINVENTYPMSATVRWIRSDGLPNSYQQSYGHD